MLCQPVSDTLILLQQPSVCIGIDKNEIARFGDPGRLGVSYNRLCDHLSSGLMQIQVVGNSLASIAACTH